MSAASVIPQPQPHAPSTPNHQAVSPDAVMVSNDSPTSSLQVPSVENKADENDAKGSSMVGVQQDIPEEMHASPPASSSEHPGSKPNHQATSDGLHNSLQDAIAFSINSNHFSSNVAASPKRSGTKRPRESEVESGSNKRMCHDDEEKYTPGSYVLTKVQRSLDGADDKEDDDSKDEEIVRLFVVDRSGHVMSPFSFVPSINSQARLSDASLRIREMNTRFIRAKHESSSKPDIAPDGGKAKVSASSNEGDASEDKIKKRQGWAFAVFNRQRKPTKSGIPAAPRIRLCCSLPVENKHKLYQAPKPDPDLDDTSGNLGASPRGDNNIPENKDTDLMHPDIDTSSQVEIAVLDDQDGVEDEVLSEADLAIDELFDDDDTQEVKKKTVEPAPVSKASPVTSSKSQSAPDAAPSSSKRSPRNYTPVTLTNTPRRSSARIAAGATPKSTPKKSDSPVVAPAPKPKRKPSLAKIHSSKEAVKQEVNKSTSTVTKASSSKAADKQETDITESSGTKTSSSKKVDKQGANKSEPTGTSTSPSKEVDKPDIDKSESAGTTSFTSTTKKPKGKGSAKTEEPRTSVSSYTVNKDFSSLAAGPDSSSQALNDDLHHTKTKPPGETKQPDATPAAATTVKTDKVYDGNHYRNVSTSGPLDATTSTSESASTGQISARMKRTQIRKKTKLEKTNAKSGTEYQSQSPVTSGNASLSVNRPLTDQSNKDQLAIPPPQFNEPIPQVINGSAQPYSQPYSQPSFQPYSQPVMNPYSQTYPPTSDLPTFQMVWDSRPLIEALPMPLQTYLITAVTKGTGHLPPIVADQTQGMNPNPFGGFGTAGPLLPQSSMSAMSTAAPSVTNLHLSSAPYQYSSYPAALSYPSTSSAPYPTYGVGPPAGSYTQLGASGTGTSNPQAAPPAAAIPYWRTAQAQRHGPKYDVSSTTDSGKMNGHESSNVETARVGPPRKRSKNTTKKKGKDQTTTEDPALTTNASNGAASTNIREQDEQNGAETSGNVDANGDLDADGDIDLDMYATYTLDMLK
ncbi:hypothetical protein FB446DRAFT_132383 [Lentinula raphanica]|nr:hypothetical protein FB446DRAFT_132383 [Lentinula raphanica]